MPRHCSTSMDQTSGSTPTSAIMGPPKEPSRRPPILPGSRLGCSASPACRWSRAPRSPSSIRRVAGSRSAPEAAASDGHGRMCLRRIEPVELDQLGPEAKLSRPAMPSEVPGGAGVGDAGAAEDSGAVDTPDIDLAAGILKQDVGAAVVVVVADPHDMPARPGVAEAAAADPGGAVHLPGHDFAVVVLKQDVRAAVPVDVAGAPGVPARAGVAEAGVGDRGGPADLPDHGLAAVVLQQDVGAAVAVER